MTALLYQKSKKKQIGGSFCFNYFLKNRGYFFFSDTKLSAHKAKDISLFFLFCSDTVCVFLIPKKIENMSVPLLMKL